MKRSKPPTRIDDRSRRRFLSWMLVSAAFFSGLLRKQRADASISGRHHYSIEILLNRIVSDRRAARQIGRLYLATHPEENDRDRLLSDLVGRGEVADVKALRQRIAGLRERDFACEDTVVIEGWVLARIEARICALISVL